MGEFDAFVTIPTPQRQAYTLISQQAVVHATHSIYLATNNPHRDKLKRLRDVT